MKYIKMGHKTRKTLKNLLLYGVPLVVASFLPMKEAKGQMVKIDNPNTLYLVLQPADLGLGIRYNREFPWFGIYSSVSKGKYGLGDGEYIKNHFKFALGGLIYLRKNQPENVVGHLSLGATYHTYGERNYEPETINEKGLKSLSFELGGGVKRKNLNAAIRMDILKWESALDFGISF